MANADKLTIDAQSALRRCIEVYNHTTRFFIVIEDKYKLLKPILSRFCEIYIPAPIVCNTPLNLNKFKINNLINTEDLDSKRRAWLHTELNKKSKTLDSLNKKIDKLYEKSYSALDVMNFIEGSTIDENFKWGLLLTFHKIKKEFRNEKLVMFFLLNYFYFRLENNLENILIM